MTDSKDFVLGVVIGSAIGAAAALLYAPQSGQVTREQLRDRAGDARNRAGELYDTGRTRAVESLHQAQSKAGELIETGRARASETLHQAQSKATETIGQVQSKASEVTDQARGAVERGREFVEQQKEAVVTAVDAGKTAFAAKQEELKAQVAEDTLPAGTPTV